MSTVHASEFALIYAAYSRDGKTTVPPTLPWIGLRPADGVPPPRFTAHLELLRRNITAHIRAETLKPFSPVMAGAPADLNQWFYAMSKSELGIHVVFYELILVPRRVDNSSAFMQPNTIRLYGQGRQCLRRGSFTVRVTSRVLEM